MSTKKADKELVINESGDVSAVDASVPLVAPPKRSYQVDDKEGYTSTILIDGHKVFIREMTKAEFAAYVKRSRAIAAKMTAFQAASAAGEFDEETASEHTIAISDEQAEHYADIVADHVKGWELPKTDGAKLPCTPETKVKLPLSLKCEMSMKILQKSRMGQDESGF